MQKIIETGAKMRGREQPEVKELQEKVVRYFCDRPGNFPLKFAVEKGIEILSKYPL